MSTANNIAVLLEAKNEYNKHLVTVFKEQIIRILKNIYADSESLCAQENTPENVFMVFQDNLSKIKNWSGTKLANEYNEIKRRSGCDWLDDLIKVVFVTNIKIMTMANKIKKGAEINIKIPAGTQILYLCILDSARKIWSRPYLFNKRNHIEYQRNMVEVDTIIDGVINDVLRTQLPVKNILQDYLEIDSATTTSISSPVPEITNKVVKKLVQHELTELKLNQDINTFQTQILNKSNEPKNKYKSKIAELLAKPATKSILPHNPDTDLIDIDAIEEKPAPAPVVVTPTVEEKPAPAPVVVTPVVEEPVTKPIVAPVVEEPVAKPIVTPAEVIPSVEEKPAEPAVVTATAPVVKEQQQTVTKQTKTSSESLADLLSSAELADIDLELEDYSVESLINQKTALIPIKVKKSNPGNIVFFKNAPKFRS